MSNNMRLIQKVIAIVLLVVCIGTEAAAQGSLNPPKPRPKPQPVKVEEPSKPSRQSSSSASKPSKPTPSRVSTSGVPVDLGLSVKWASCNVGASSESDYGDYFAWGELSPKSSYTSDNCKTYERNIGDISGNESYDVARAKWGRPWRLPTKSEFEELVNRCSWNRATRGGHSGYEVTGPNGNSIFLPAAGWRYGASLNNEGEFGYYWSSTPVEGVTQYACDLYFSSGSQSVDWGSRYNGHIVRPVCD